MLHFTDQNEFDKEMARFMDILEIKGFVLESDHIYAYEVQHSDAFTDICEWLAAHGYSGPLDKDGYHNDVSGAFYALYDADRVSYEQIHNELIREANREAKK